MEIVKKLSLVAAVAVFAIAGTGAYFSDREVLSGNTFTSGVLDMAISEETTSVNIENMKPGDSTTQTVTIYSNGTLDFGSLAMSLENIQDEGALLGALDTSITYVANAGTENENSTTLDTIKANNISALELINGENSYLLPGNTATILVTFSLPSDTGNEYQNLSASFDMAFDGGQVK